MKVLHVEDNVYKHSDIEKQLRKLHISDVTWIQNLQDGLDLISREHFDLIITDMSFPLHEDEKENEDAGDMLIDYINTNKIATPVILITAFRMSKPGILGTVHYDPSELWEDDLTALIARN